MDMLDVVLMAALLEWFFDLIHSSTNWSLHPWLWCTDIPQSDIMIISMN